MAFENLDMRDAACFGWCPKGPDTNWYKVAQRSIDIGWSEDIRARVEKDLAVNVKASYFYICEGEFEDIDTGIRWRCSFMNDHMMWQLRIVDSPDADVTPEDAKAFFSSEMIQKFAKRCGDLIARAAKQIQNLLEPYLETGELLDVDEIKLSRIMDCVDKEYFMDNLRTRKFEMR